jgi:chromosome segregation ATPase
MSSTKQSLINEKDYAVSKLKEEIALAKVELSRAQADIFSLNQDVDHYKATVKKAKNENKSNEDTIKYHELLKMNEESRQDKNAEIQEYTKALVSCQDDAEELKKSVKELKSKIKSKDERITNLEAKRLTKEHVAMIKKLKVRVCICVSESSFNLSCTHLYIYSQLLGGKTII